MHLSKLTAAFIVTTAVSGSLAPSAMAAEQLDAQYKFYWKGLLVSSAETQLKVTDETYDFALDFRIRGVAKLFANGRSAARVSGRLDGDHAMPLVYETDGRWDGEDYAQTMTFDNNGALVDQKLDWPEKWLEEFKREPVPDEMKRGPDPASLLVKLIGMPVETATGDEPLRMHSFDGDTVFEYGITCQPEPVVLEKSGHSPYSGEAYECGFDGKLVAGKRILNEKQQKKADKRRRKEEKRRAKGKKDKNIPPKLWVQSFENGAYLLPVRAEVSTDMGRVKMYLSQLDVSNPDSASAASPALLAVSNKAESSR